MLATFLYALRRQRGQVVGWGTAMFLTGILLVPFYTTIKENAAQFEALLSAYPPEFLAFFGGISDLGTPEGYLNLEYFSLVPLILGVFSVLAGTGLVAGEEEKGTLDLLLAYPVSRTDAFLGRVFAYLAATALILAISWLGVVIPALAIDMGPAPLDLARPFVSLAAVLLVFGSLGLFFSIFLPSRRLASMFGGVLLVFSYFVTSLARINTDLEPLARLSPLAYFQSSNAEEGLNTGWILGLIAVALLMGVLSWWGFTRKDIRIAGEGGWSRPRWPRLGLRSRL